MNPADIVSVDLGYLRLEDIHKTEFVQEWIRERIKRWNLDLVAYEIHIDQTNGRVIARHKSAWTSPEHVKATIKYD